jgi:hypothetical protein
MRRHEERPKERSGDMLRRRYVRYSHTDDEEEITRELPAHARGTPQET